MSIEQDKDEDIISHIEAFRQMLLKCILCLGIFIIPNIVRIAKMLGFIYKTDYKGKYCSA